jgi:3-hydroxyisobutyrate dehydrogenase-like beta-hydroxyacid dehydrogenase
MGTPMDINLFQIRRCAVCEQRSKVRAFAERGRDTICTNIPRWRSAGIIITMVPDTRMWRRVVRRAQVA